MKRSDPGNAQISDNAITGWSDLKALLRHGKDRKKIYELVLKNTELVNSYLNLKEIKDNFSSEIFSDFLSHHLTKIDCSQQLKGILPYLRADQKLPLIKKTI